MDWTKANKKQLLTIIIHEECSQGFIDEALRELRIRERCKKVIIELFNAGWDTWWIAEETGIHHQSVCSMIGGLKRRGA